MGENNKKKNCGHIAFGVGVEETTRQSAKCHHNMMMLQHGFAVEGLTTDCHRQRCRHYYFVSNKQAREICRAHNNQHDDRIKVGGGGGGRALRLYGMLHAFMPLNVESNCRMSGMLFFGQSSMHLLATTTTTTIINYYYYCCLRFLSP